MKQFLIRIGLILLTAIFIASGWYLLSPLFLNRTVNETSPFVFPAKEEVGMLMPPTRSTAERVAAQIMMSEGKTAATMTATAIMDFVEEQPVAATHPETPPRSAMPAFPILVAQGHFVDGDSFHRGAGTATIYAPPGGDYVLRFEDFWTTNGPALNVLLSPNAAPTGSADLGKYLDLGNLKGNIGDQNYTLPAEFDPALYKSVVIYCVPFKIIFATATLNVFN